MAQFLSSDFIEHISKSLKVDKEKLEKAISSYVRPASNTSEKSKVVESSSSEEVAPKKNKKKSSESEKKSKTPVKKSKAPSSSESSKNTEHDSSSESEPKKKSKKNKSTSKSSESSEEPPSKAKGKGKGKSETHKCERIPNGKTEACGKNAVRSIEVNGETKWYCGTEKSGHYKAALGAQERNKKSETNKNSSKKEDKVKFLKHNVNNTTYYWNPESRVVVDRNTEKAYGMMNKKDKVVPLSKDAEKWCIKNSIQIKSESESSEKSKSSSKSSESVEESDSGSESS